MSRSHFLPLTPPDVVAPPPSLLGRLIAAATEMKETGRIDVQRVGPPELLETPPVNTTTALKDLFDALPPELQFIFRTIMEGPPPCSATSSTAQMACVLNGWRVVFGPVKVSFDPPPAEGGAA